MTWATTKGTFKGTGTAIGAFIDLADEAGATVDYAASGHAAPSGPVQSAAYEALAGRAERYNPFNLLVFDGAQLMGLESRGARILKMEPGIGAVSNANFHTPWPKLTRLRQALETQIEHLQLQGNHTIATRCVLQCMRIATCAA